MNDTEEVDYWFTFSEMTFGLAQEEPFPAYNKYIGKPEINTSSVVNAILSQAQDQFTRTYSKEKEKEKKKKPLRLYEVDIVEVHGDLGDGVTGKTMQELYGPPLPIITEKEDDYHPGHRDDDGNYIVSFDTYCNQEYNHSTLWSIFKVNAVEIISDYNQDSLNGCQKYVLNRRRLKAKIVGDGVPYIQFKCNVPVVKHNGFTFKEGDILTLFVKMRKKNIITILPSLQQTYVPIFPTQKLQIVIRSDEELLFKKLKSIQSYGCKLLAGHEEHLRCYYFDCLSMPKEQDIMFVRSGINLKSIHITPIDELSCPIICNPLSSCFIYAGNIKSFILRSVDKITLNLKKELEHIYAMETGGYNEVKVSITKNKSQVILERKNGSWLAGC